MSKQHKPKDPDPIVQELFARSVAGVFARRSRRGVLSVRYPRLAPWTLTLGLAVRLQNDAAKAAIDSSGVPPIDRIIAPYAEATSTDVATATTDLLLAELYRSLKDDWVLGLFRPRRERYGHWSGLCWGGSPVGCAGIASVLVQTIQSNVLAARLKSRKRRAPMEEVGELMELVFLHAQKFRVPSRTWIAGALQMAQHVIRETGHDGRPGDDLESFVRIDWGQE